MTNEHSKLAAKSSPAGLAALDSGGIDRGWFELPPHLQVLDGKLKELANPYRPNSRRLLVTMPPRHGKSMMTSHYYPAWFLGTFPDKRIILCGYGTNFAEEWGGKARDVLERWGEELWGVKVSASSSAASRWNIEVRRGGMVATGAGGSITGRGADLLLIDDPIKGHEDADSEVMRGKLWDWYLSTARTRLEPGGGIVLIQTRWNEDDLAGRILAEAATETGEDWEIVNFPALAESYEEAVLPDGGLWTRRPGDALWPGRYPEVVLGRLRDMQHPYWWAALYQQRPAPQGGGTFKREWFRYYEEDELMDFYLLPREEGGPPLRFNRSDVTKFSTVDLATSIKETADWTVIATWCLLRDGPKSVRLLLLDVDRRRLEGPDIVPALRAAFAKWRPGAMHVESGGFQLAIVQEARRAGLPIRELKADTDKLTRSMLAQAGMESGRILFRHGASWLQELENELLMFPNGRHDDQVDVVSYAARIMGLGEEGYGVAVIPEFLNRTGRRTA